MPHVIVKLWPGKSREKKSRLAAEVTRAVTEVLDYGEDSVSVSIEEITAQDWPERVYRPDIQAKWSSLYKKPGYRM